MDAQTKPLVTFVTVNYKTPHHVRHLLDGISRASFPFSFEYILVDNASGDGTPDMVRERYPWVRVIESSKNGGFGFGNNLGIKEARGEYIILFNPDLTIFPGETEAWIDWMRSHPDVGISGPRMLNPDNSDQESCYRFPSIWTPVLRRTRLGSIGPFRKSMDRYVMKDMDRAREQDVDWVLGAAICLRASALEKFGRFDERYFMYLEDADICRRAWSMGYRVCYAPVASYIHYHGRESRIQYPWEFFTNRLARVHLMSGFKYFLKHLGQPNPRPNAL